MTLHLTKRRIEMEVQGTMLVEVNNSSDSPYQGHVLDVAQRDSTGIVLMDLLRSNYYDRTTCFSRDPSKKFALLLEYRIVKKFRLDTKETVHTTVVKTNTWEDAL